MSNGERKFGLVYLEGTPQSIDPGARAAAEHFKRLLAQQGVALAAEVAYIFDVSQQQQQATSIVAQMVSAGVNNLICMCDALYPIFLTNEATKQQWYPEWLITGTGLTDTTFFGRTYDSVQWQGAFGISPLWVFFSRLETSSGYQAQHHMMPDLEERSTTSSGTGLGVGVRQVAWQIMMTGIHFAGPRLHPADLRRGDAQSSADRRDTEASTRLLHRHQSELGEGLRGGVVEQHRIWHRRDVQRWCRHPHEVERWAALRAR